VVQILQCRVRKEVKLVVGQNEPPARGKIRLFGPGGGFWFKRNTKREKEIKSPSFIPRETDGLGQRQFSPTHRKGKGEKRKTAIKEILKKRKGWRWRSNRAVQQNLGKKNKMGGITGVVYKKGADAVESNTNTARQ